MSIRLTLAAAATLGLAVVLAPISPTSAAPPIHETESFTDPAFVVEDFCDVTGLDVTFVNTLTIDRVIKKGDRGPAYYIEHFTISSTHTANGVTTTYTERSLSKDLQLSYDPETHLLTIDTLATGNSTLYGPDGKAIARNPGQVRFHIVYNVVTDVEVSFEQTKESTGRSDDFCAVEVPLFSA